MISTLRLGLFHFRNDDVVLIAGDRSTIAALGQHLQAAFNAGETCVAIHALAVVSARHPASLFAVRGDVQPCAENAFAWRCRDADVQRLVTAGSAASELYFDLASTPPYLYVNFTGHYGDAWWATYG